MSASDDSRCEALPSQNGSGHIKFLHAKRKPERGLYLLAAGVLLAALLYAWWYQAAFVPAHQDAQRGKAPQITDHLWVDRVPEVETDAFQLYFFSGDDPIGLHDDGQSVYKHVLEIFQFRGKEGELTLSFPHDRRTAKTTYTLEKLSRPKGDLDLQLTIAADPQNKGEAHTYYTSTRWSQLDRSTWPAGLRNLPITGSR